MTVMHAFLKPLFLTALAVVALFSATFAQKTVEKDPFLRWKVVAEGLEYSSVLVEPSGGNGHFLSNQIAPDQGVVVGLLKPTGFQSVDGKVTFGLGVRIVNSDTGEELLYAKDIYEGQEAVDPSALQRLTVKFQPEDKTQRVKNYFVTVTFFDKKSDAKAVVTLPLKVVPQSDIALSSHFHSSWTITPSYKLISQNIKSEGSEIRINRQKSVDLSWSRTDRFEFVVDTAAFSEKNFQSYVSLTDGNGKTRYEATKEHDKDWDGKSLLNLSSDSLPAAPYLVTVAVSTESGEVGFSEWFYYRADEKFLSSSQKKEFAQLHLASGKRLNRAKECQDALQELENALFYSPTLAEAFREQGNAYQQLNKLESATHSFEKALALDSTSTMLLNKLGEIYKKQKEYPQALKNYQQSLLLDSAQYMSNYQVGWLANEMGDYAAALPFLSRAVALNPANYYQPYLERILANRKLKNYEEVVADYEVLASRYPTHADYLYQIGYYQIELKKYAEAIEAFDRAIALDAYDYKPLYEKAYAQKMQGDYKQSLKNFEQAAKLGGSRVPNAIYLNMGDLHYLLKNNQKACENYQIAKDKLVKNAAARLKEYCDK